MRRRHDEDRPSRMFGDLVRDAPLEDFAGSLEAAGAEHDHSRVDFVGDLDNAFPARRGETRSCLGVESGASCQFCAGSCALAGVVHVQLLEGRTWCHRRHHSEALRRCQRRADVQDDSAVRSEEVGCCVDCALSIVGA